MKPDTCKHFNGIQHKTCDAGILYDSVKEIPEEGSTRRPCLPDFVTRRNDICRTVCPKREYPTPEEIAAFEAEWARAIEQFLSRLASGQCPHCGQAVTKRRQVGRCVYAEPCGHRLGQGKA